MGCEVLQEQISSRRRIWQLDKEMAIWNDPFCKMLLRVAETAVALLLGFVLAWQSVFAATSAPAAKSVCCRTGCGSKSCSTPPCCVKPDAPSAPVVPDPARSATENELLAIMASVVPSLMLPSKRVDEA